MVNVRLGDKPVVLVRMAVVPVLLELRSLPKAEITPKPALVLEIGV